MSVEAKLYWIWKCDPSHIIWLEVHCISDDKRVHWIWMVGTVIQLYRAGAPQCHLSNVCDIRKRVYDVSLQIYTHTYINTALICWHTRSFTVFDINTWKHFSIQTILLLTFFLNDPVHNNRDIKHSVTSLAYDTILNLDLISNTKLDKHKSYCTLLTTCYRYLDTHCLLHWTQQAFHWSSHCSPRSSYCTPKTSNWSMQITNVWMLQAAAQTKILKNSVSLGR